ncbi:MAG TPA: response regulator [Pseudomonadales bacterium]
MIREAVHILLVEDDSIDAKAFIRAMEKLKIANPVVHAKDGVEGLEKLRQLPRPNLVILDINMPRMNGLEMLRRVREDEALRDTIVFVLTTSNDEKDKFEAYNLNVAGYMLKSDMGNSFVRAVSLVDNYWKVVEFPLPRAAMA